MSSGLAKSSHTNTQTSAQRRLSAQKAHPELIRGVWNHLVTLSDRLDALHVYLLAAGLSFNVLLCLLPLLLLAIYVASSIVDLDLVIGNVQRTLLDALPATSGTMEFVRTIIDEIRVVRDTSRTAGYVGLGILIWTSSALFSSLRTAFNAIFSISTPRFFLWYRIKDVFFTIVVAVLILASTLLTPLASVFSSSLTQAVPWMENFHLSSIIALGISAITAFISFGILLRFVPNKPQPLFIIVTASLSSMVLWESARFGFTYYLNHIAEFGRFYGTFSVLVASAIWIYYSALIILVSAEVAEYTYEQRRARARLSKAKDRLQTTPTKTNSAKQSSTKSAKQ